MKTVLSIIFIFWTATILSSHAVAENYNDRFIAEDAAVIAFTNARVIDGTGAKAKEKYTVIVRDGRITKIGRDGKVKIPKEAKRISLKGKSLLPGWVMTHEHLFYLAHQRQGVPGIGHASVNQPINYPRLYLSAGVTSARTAISSFPYGDLGIKRAIDDGVLIGPDFALTSPGLNGPIDTDPLVIEHNTYSLKGFDFRNTQQVREFVRFWGGLGFTTFKAYVRIPADQLAALIDEAHKLGLKVTGDMGHGLQRQHTAIDLGIDFLEHAIGHLDDNADDPNAAALGVKDAGFQHLMQRIIDNDIPVSYTLALYDPQFYDPAKTPSEELNLLHDDLRDYKDLQPRLGDNSFLKAKQEMVLEFWRKGGMITVGSDAVWRGYIAGYGNLRSIELLVDAGIPALEVIKMATNNGAEALDIADDRGTIDVGKRADLIIMNGSPDNDIKAIYNIETVFKNGIGYNPQALRDSVKGAVGVAH